ncbi:MAG: hypothetical protein M3384_21020 [Acidobacteriota bacterium]|nr:hypothetical protein [Acidobacteriota bacterium]
MNIEDADSATGILLFLRAWNKMFSRPLFLSFPFARFAPLRERILRNPLVPQKSFFAKAQSAQRKFVVFRAARFDS